MIETKQLKQLQPIDEPLTMFLLGATGDLARKKILKALFELYQQKLLPQRFRLIAVGRSALNQEEYRAMVKEVVGVDDEGMLVEFVDAITYISGDLTDIATYKRIKEVHMAQAEMGGCGNHLWYLATLPSLYVSIARFIGQVGLNHSNCGWTKLLIEKPFGTDVESARQLNQFLTGIFREEQIYRIDHFLAKETVQNLLTFRFGNGLFEYLWDRRHIDHIQVQTTETIGVEGRGEFFEGVGAVRDMVQNHAVQLMVMTMMEEPKDLSAQAINESRNKLLTEMRIWENDPKRFVRFGQYDNYVTEAGLKVKTSLTETAVAAVFEVNNERWRGVPIFLRSGKRMQQTVVEISIQFKEPQNKLFGMVGQRGNVLSLRIQPNEGVVLRLNAKRPGLTLATEEVPMQFCYRNVFQMGLVEAYVKLLYDAIVGNGQLFSDAKGIEASWQVMEPILQLKRQPGCRVEPYVSGSWGPKSFDDLIKEMGRSWLEPSMTVCAI